MNKENDEQLLAAASAKNFQALSEALNKGANVNSKNKQGRTSLHISVINNSLDIVKLD